MLSLLFSQYELLETTASYLSAVDLYNTALTCSSLFELILKSDTTFTNLKKLTLCDGSGLLARQNFQGIYNGLRSSGILNWRKDRGPGWRPYPCYANEEFEIRVWSLKCDAANTSPCEKCGINICKECRYVPRYRNHDAYDPSRRPHHNTTFQCWNVIVYCEACDPAVDKKTGGSFCDCDRYARWICLRCNTKEGDEESWYYRHCNALIQSDDPNMWESGMVLPDHQDERIVRHLSFMVSVPSLIRLGLVLVSLRQAAVQNGQHPLHVV